MKAFSISQLLIYDPTRQSSKRKPIEIDIQQAKIVSYYPQEVALEQKCNTVGMAEGVYNFCFSLFNGRQPAQVTQQSQRKHGWQTIYMDVCTLVLKQVQDNIWIFVKLQHQKQAKYYRLGQKQEDNYYLDNSFTEETCCNFMDHFYKCFKTFYGPIRGWIFREKFEELQKIITALVIRYQEIFKYDQSLDIIEYFIKDFRQIPLDVNSTLKFTYFKNVLQSYDHKISHLIIFASSFLAYSSLHRQDSQFFANYLFGNGDPYYFVVNRKNRLNILQEIPKSYVSQKFGIAYNSKMLGLDEPKDLQKSSLGVSKNTDLLGIGVQNNKLQLFQVYLHNDDMPYKLNFYSQNSMLFITFSKQNPTLNEVIFQNRFYHDNSDKFIAKINETLPSLLKPNDPFKFLFHNMSTYSGKSTIKDWKYVGAQVRNIFEHLQRTDECTTVSLNYQNQWIYGVRRLSRILIILISSDVSLNKLDDYVDKMTKQYFTRAYV